MGIKRMMKKVGEHQKHCLGLIVQRHHMWKNREEERKKTIIHSQRSFGRPLLSVMEGFLLLPCHYTPLIYRQTTSWWNLCFHGNTVRLQAG